MKNVQHKKNLTVFLSDFSLCSELSHSSLSLSLPIPYVSCPCPRTLGLTFINYKNCTFNQITSYSITAFGSNTLYIPVYKISLRVFFISTFKQVRNLPMNLVKRCYHWRKPILLRFNFLKSVVTTCWTHEILMWRRHWRHAVVLKCGVCLQSTETALLPF